MKMLLRIIGILLILIGGTLLVLDKYRNVAYFLSILGIIGGLIAAVDNNKVMRQKVQGFKSKFLLRLFFICSISFVVVYFLTKIMI